MAKKIVLCRCEDVTLADLEHCVDRGYLDIEEVKRYTGFGTGPCQGKECLGPMATQLARLTGKPPSAIPPFTSRPPLAPTPIRLLANSPDAHRFEDDKPGERPARSSAAGDAKVDDKPGERPARSSAAGDAKVDDKPGERPARSSAAGDAKVDHK